MKKSTFTIYLVVIFVVLCFFAWDVQKSMKKSQQKETTPTAEINEPNSAEQAYDFMNDSNLPMELREKINSMIVALNTGDVNSYCATYDRQGMYDLLTGKTTISDTYGRFNSWDADDINELEEYRVELIKSSRIKSFDDFCNYIPESFSDYFEKPISKFTITSAVIDSNAIHVKVYYDIKQNNGKITKCNTDWVYYNKTWWQQDGF